MNRTALLAVTGLLLVAGILCLVVASRYWSWRARPEFEAEAVPTSTAPVDPLKEFSLTDQTGAPFGTKQLEGQVHVVSFFFATCPSICRSENQKIQILCDKWGERGVKFVSITCDPETDTPTALNNYARLFNANPEYWKFLTGDLLYIRRIGSEMYSALVDKQTHSERLIVVDRWGKVRGRYHWNKPEEVAKMETLFGTLLDETSPPADDSDTTATPQPAMDEETGRPIELTETAK